MFFKKNPEKERLKQERKQKELELKEQKNIIKEENKRRRTTFKKTKSFVGISFDEITETFKINTNYFNVFKFDELVDYNLIENGQTVVQGGVSLKRAAAGGILLGGAGMIIGGLTGKKKIEDHATEIKIEFKVKGLNEGTYEINLLSKPVKKDTLTYKGTIIIAKDIISFFDKISNVE
nr:MAG TPA: hypothetical protein [Caudoviricetes sp.]